MNDLAILSMPPYQQIVEIPKIETKTTINRIVFEFQSIALLCIIKYFVWSQRRTLTYYAQVIHSFILKLFGDIWLLHTHSHAIFMSVYVCVSCLVRLVVGGF